MNEIMNLESAILWIRAHQKSYTRNLTDTGFRFLYRVKMHLEARLDDEVRNG